MNRKSFAIISVMVLVIIGAVLTLIFTVKSINARDDLPLSTKLLLDEIHKARNERKVSESDSGLDIKCLKSKLKLTRLWIDNEIKEKPSELLLARAKAAYEISTFPCIKLPPKIAEFDEARKSAIIKNSTIVKCIKNELKKLSENSPFLDGFESQPEKNVTNCHVVADFILDSEKSHIQNIYETAQLQKCKRDEFLQLEKLKVKVFEEYLAPTFNMSDSTFKSFTDEFGLNIHTMAEKQIDCIFKEIY